MRMKKRTWERIDRDVDDVLSTLDLVDGNQTLRDELFERLVDLLLERILVDLTRATAEGRLSRPQYTEELTRLAGQCRRVGLLHGT